VYNFAWGDRSNTQRFCLVGAGISALALRAFYERRDVEKRFASAVSFHTKKSPYAIRPPNRLVRTGSQNEGALLPFYGAEVILKQGDSHPYFCCKSGSRYWFGVGNPSLSPDESLSTLENFRRMVGNKGKVIACCMDPKNGRIYTTDSKVYEAWAQVRGDPDPVILSKSFQERGPLPLESKHLTGYELPLGTSIYFRDLSKESVEEFQGVIFIFQKSSNSSNE
jgi:hypothetical protein